LELTALAVLPGPTLLKLPAANPTEVQMRSSCFSFFSLSALSILSSFANRCKSNWPGSASSSFGKLSWTGVIEYNEGNLWFLKLACAWTSITA
jgi:hypothetical protein